MDFRFRTWNGGRCNSVKKNKKGLSLVFVIVTVLALIIFSALVFTASIASLSMTGLSTDGRQTYLKAKSAIQYTRTLVCEKAKNGNLVEFSVGPDGDSYKELTTSQDPNGTSCYTLCKNMGGSQWKIFALVKNRNSGKMQKLNYTFTLNNSGALCPDSFLLAGSRFDNNAQVINANGNSFNISSPTQSPYPLVLNASNMVCGSTVTSRAPEAYFIGDGGIQFSANPGAQWTLSTNFLYIRTKLTAGASLNQKFILENDGGDGSSNSDYQIHLNNGYDGIVCFGADNAVQLGGTTQNIPAGYYYFKNGTDLLDPGTYTDLQNGLLKKITNIAEIENGTPSATVRVGGSSNSIPYATKAYMTNIDYLNSSRKPTGNQIVSSERDGGIGWTAEGKLQSDVIGGNPQADKDVYLNLCQNGLNELQNLHIPLTFTAHSIGFQVTPSSASPVFTVPGQSFIFQVDSSDSSAPGWLWLNVQDYNGSPWLKPWKDTDVSTVTTLKATPGSSFIVGYPADSSKSVILVLPHGLRVVDQNGNTSYELPQQTTNPSGDNYYNPQDPSTYTYTVPSGTNLLDSNDVGPKIRKYIPTSTPIPGGNSYTITDGRYTFT